MSCDNECILRILIEWQDYILKRLEDGRSKLKDYDYLRNELLNTNVAKDLRYQIVYKRFYAMNGRAFRSQWVQPYFSLLECMKVHSDPSFTTAICELNSVTKRVETSFGSKLIATIDPETPAYDEWVRKNLCLDDPKTFPKEVRIAKAKKIYSELKQKTFEITQLDDFHKLRTAFDDAFPQHTHFTDIKKLDLFLWQARVKRYCQGKLRTCSLIPHILEHNERVLNNPIRHSDNILGKLKTEQSRRSILSNYDQRRAVNLDGLNFWQSIYQLRKYRVIPYVWKISDLKPHLQGKFKVNGINTIPYNDSMRRDRTEIGFNVKNGKDPRAWRVGPRRSGQFQLIDDPHGN